MTERVTESLLVALLLAGIGLMAQLGVGPFSHERFHHWHTRFMAQPKGVRLLQSALVWAVIVLASGHLIGLWP